MRNSLACLLIGLLLSGCASVHYVPYTGEQDHWKPAPGATVDYRAGVIPVYSGLPSHPFTVIGVVTASDRQTSHKTLIWLASVKAQKEGAQALIIAHQSKDYAGSVGTFNGYFAGSSPGSTTSAEIYDNTVSLWAIQWKK
jgi:uncharacterized protein YceK